MVLVYIHVMCNEVSSCLEVRKVNSHNYFPEKLLSGSVVTIVNEYSGFMNK